MPDLEFVIVNEFLVQKLERFACAFIDIFLLYITINRKERKFATSIVPLTRSITVPGAFL